MLVRVRSEYTTIKRSASDDAASLTGTKVLFTRPNNLASACLAHLNHPSDDVVNKHAAGVRFPQIPVETTQIAATLGGFDAPAVVKDAVAQMASIDMKAITATVASIDMKAITAIVDSVSKAGKVARQRRKESIDKRWANLRAMAAHRCAKAVNAGRLPAATEDTSTETKTTWRCRGHHPPPPTLNPRRAPIASNAPNTQPGPKAMTATVLVSLGDESDRHC